MRLYRLSQLPEVASGHVFGGIVEGRFISTGGMLFLPRKHLAHADEPRHVHDTQEVFVMLQGEAVVHFENRDEPLSAGEVMVIEPGENHHLESDAEDPPVMLYLHCGQERHPGQVK